MRQQRIAKQSRRSGAQTEPLDLRTPTGSHLPF
jgi:hypothetical protein